MCPLLSVDCTGSYTLQLPKRFARNARCKHRVHARPDAMCSPHTCVPFLPSQLFNVEVARVRRGRDMQNPRSRSRYRASSALPKKRNNWERRRTKRYLRVDGILGVPAVALEHSHGGIAVHVREAHELSDRSLLLRCVCWRHLALVCVSSLSMSLLDRGRGSEDESRDGAARDVRCGKRRESSEQSVIGK